MMYIANKQMKIAGRDGSVRLVSIGDPIPEFDTFNEVAKRSLINQGWVTKTEKSLAPTESVFPPESDLLACQNCGRQFASSRALKTHISRAHQS